MRTRVLRTAGLIVLAVIPLINLALAYWLLTNSKVNLRIKQWIVGLVSVSILIFLALFLGAPGIPGGPGVELVVSLGSIPMLALWIVAMWQTTRPEDDKSTDQTG